MEPKKAPFSEIKHGGRFYLSEKSAAIGEYCTKFPEPVVTYSTFTNAKEAMKIGAEDVLADPYNAIFCLGWFVRVSEDRQVIPKE